MNKIKATSSIIFLSLFLFGCVTSQVEKTPFDPKDFADQQTAIINETAELGPKSRDERNLSGERRIYIDENMVTDYT